MAYFSHSARCAPPSDEGGRRLRRGTAATRRRAPSARSPSVGACVCHGAAWGCGGFAGAQGHTHGELEAVLLRQRGEVRREVPQGVGRAPDTDCRTRGAEADGAADSTGTRRHVAGGGLAQSLGGWLC